jgi:tetratricopeptide (TPR) repeat protein
MGYPSFPNEFKSPVMKNLLIFCLFTFSIGTFYSQDEAGALTFIEEGIQLHDKGNYEAAVKKYDAALRLDKDNFYALAEKANSLNSQAKFEEAIVVSRKCIEIHPDEMELDLVYVAYGNALDGLHKSEESVELYEEGISKFPEFYLLHFNKGITLISLKEYDQALLCFEQAAKYNPSHAGSQNAIGRFQKKNSKNIPAILAYCRFFVIDLSKKWCL